MCVWFLVIIIYVINNCLVSWCESCVRTFLENGGREDGCCFCFGAIQWIVCNFRHMAYKWTWKYIVEKIYGGIEGKWLGFWKTRAFQSPNRFSTFSCCTIFLVKWQDKVTASRNIAQNCIYNGGQWLRKVVPCVSLFLFLRVISLTFFCSRRVRFGIQTKFVWWKV